VPVPAVCRDRPDQVVLLLRIPLGPGTLSGVFCSLLRPALISRTVAIYFYFYAWLFSTR
jgi:hypothetical protein